MSWRPAGKEGINGQPRYPSFPASGRVHAMSAVSDNLRRILGHRGMSSDELGRKIGSKDGRYIRMIIAGTKYPSSDMIGKIAGGLGIPREELTRLPGPRPPA